MKLQVQTVFLISATESSIQWEEFDVPAWPPDENAAMKIAEMTIEVQNQSRKWSIGAGYNWRGREYERRAVGVKTPSPEPRRKK